MSWTSIIIGLLIWTVLSFFIGSWLGQILKEIDESSAPPRNDSWDDLDP